MMTATFMSLVSMRDSPRGILPVHPVGFTNEELGNVTASAARRIFFAPAGRFVGSRR